MGQHKNSHPYRIVTRHRFPIFTSDWSADEELLLIDGLLQFGMGNWKDAAEHVGTRSKEECERHYNQVYVDSESWPLPNMDQEFENKFAQISDDRPGKQPTSLKNKLLSSQPSNHEIVGYMPGRLEFETEHENEAEQVIKDMVINDDDTREEVELKQVVLRIYNGKLDRRIARKQFIFDRGLLEYRKNQAIEKKRAKEERDLLNKVKVFARMQTHEDFEEFTAGLLNENALRQRIAQLQDWRRNGITTLNDGAQYEVEKSQRLSRRATTLRDSAHLLDRLQKIVNARAQRERGKSTIPPPPQSIPQHTPVANGYTHNNSSSSDQTLQHNMYPFGRKPPNPLNLDGVEGVDMLSASEKDLCSRLRMYPRPYLIIKETLLSEYARTGILKRRRARELIKIDVNKTGKLYDFFVENGWIKPPRRGGNGSVTAARHVGSSNSLNAISQKPPPARPTGSFM